jgi:glycosyltransferase 2 family protein
MCPSLSPRPDRGRAAPGAEGRSGGGRAKALAALKFLWTGFVVGVAAWYLYANWEEVTGYAVALGWAPVLVALLFVTLSRLQVAAVSAAALRLVGSGIGLALSFWINAMSQLGKYVPGSVWHLVGRVAIYRRYGVPTSRGSAVIVVENVVLLVSGVCIGIALAFEAVAAAAFDDVVAVGPLGARHVVGTLLGLGTWWLLVWVLAPMLVRRFSFEGVYDSGRIFVSGVAIWMLFGLAFWMLLPVEQRSLRMLPVAIGAYALAWTAGNVALFAPAGIGVREAVLVALLGPSLGVPVAIGAAASSRIVWTIGEFATAPVAAYQLGRREGVDSLEEENL